MVLVPSKVQSIPIAFLPSKQHWAFELSTRVSTGGLAQGIYRKTQSEPNLKCDVSPFTEFSFFRRANISTALRPAFMICLEVKRGTSQTRGRSLTAAALTSPPGLAGLGMSPGAFEISHFPDLGRFVAEITLSLEKMMRAPNSRTAS